MDFVANLCGYTKFGEEFRVLAAHSVSFLTGEKSTVKHVAGLTKRLFHLVPPLRLLFAVPRPETFLRRHATFAPTVCHKLWPLHMVLNGLILI